MNMMPETLETLRSLLFVPVTEPRFLKNIRERGAGAVILDLEDAVAPDKKAEARMSLKSMRDALRAAGVPAVVRINPGDEADMDAAVAVEAEAILLPKVREAADLQQAANHVRKAEEAVGRSAGKTKLMALIETPAAIVNLPEIACAADTLIGLALGGEDLCLALGVEPTAASLTYAASRLIMSTRAAGVVPLGIPGPLGLITDTGRFRESVVLGRQLGMAGAVCIHPKQVGVINEVYADWDVSLGDARAIVHAFERALAEGKGAVMWEGRMLDLPIVERAKKIIAAHS